MKALDSKYAPPPWSCERIIDITEKVIAYLIDLVKNATREIKKGKTQNHVVKTGSVNLWTDKIPRKNKQTKII